jgi:asparagine synthase (glutamine-hydrolysing)
MCGITGVVRLDGAGADEGLVHAMTQILAHRGPDGQGVFVDGPVGLGHRRLAIIDLDTGAQPMSSEDGSVVLVFNGEIYNYRELRRELESRGRVFRTASDTEVILQSYEAFGVECLARLRGMFAFALWDGRRRRLLLARDRVGIKPLVYSWDGRRLVFGSEIKALLQDVTVARDLDWDALRDYLVFHYVPSPRTIFKSIRKLPPASYLLFDLVRAEPEVRRYWDLRLAPHDGRPDAEWTEELRWRLEDAVRSHMVSDVPLGAFLSGGMDSSAVVALMARAGGAPVRTFSIGFDETDFDELRYARAVARRYGTDHCEFVVKPDALDVLPRLAWQFDEPFADSSALPTYYVAKITREHVTVALSGDGGDETFAGYRRYAKSLELHERWDYQPLRALKPLLRAVARLVPPGARGRGYVELRSEDEVNRYYRIMTAYRDRSSVRLLNREIQAQLEPAPDGVVFQRLALEAAIPDYVSLLQYLDVRTYLPEDILTKVDRTSMLVSLEARVPLLDHVLMEFVATMPSSLKLQRGVGKLVLKRAMEADLPTEVIERRKMGFGVPLERWFRGEFGAHTREVLLDQRARRRAWIEPAAVVSVLDEHRAARRDHSAQIWALLCLEYWARQWVDM